MWQPITNIPTDGTIVDLCLYDENNDLFYRIIDAFFDNEYGWKYKDCTNTTYTVWENGKKIVAWMHPIDPPDIKLISMPINTPVVAIGIYGIPFNAHFAGIDELGNPLVWADGRTSFTETIKLKCESVEKIDKEG